MQIDINSIDYHERVVTEPELPDDAPVIPIVFWITEVLAIEVGFETTKIHQMLMYSSYITHL